MLSYCLISRTIESVSTIPDECKGVGLGMRTRSKRKTITWLIVIDDIVSALGN